jgi:hypothetical protein
MTQTINTIYDFWTYHTRLKYYIWRAGLFYFKSWEILVPARPNISGVFALLLFLLAVNTLDSFKYNQCFLSFLVQNNMFKSSTFSPASLVLLYFLYLSRKGQDILFASLVRGEIFRPSVLSLASFHNLQRTQFVASILTQDNNA